MDLSTITVADFKAKFYRGFDYQVVGQGAEDAVCDPNYVQDQDIEQAFQDAMQLFNQGLICGDDAAIANIYLYLTAHCLILNIKAANGGDSMNAAAGNFPVNSRAVGSVSESYAVPAGYTDDPIFASYLQTAYGQKYLTFMLPYIRGNVVSIIGGAHASGR